MEDLDGKIDKPKEAMSEEELQFHYFKVHDYNDDNRLDGIEIISALTHHAGLSLLLLSLHPFSGLFSRTTWVSRYQKGETSPDLNEARDDGVLRR